MSRNPDGLRLSLGEARLASAKRQNFSTGSATIDALLSGGFRTGEMVEVYGASASGKTQLAFQAAVIAASGGARVTFVDTEGAFRPERLATMAKRRALSQDNVLSRVFCKRAATVAEQFSSVGDLQKDDRIRDSKLIIVDTVSKNFAFEYGGQKGMLERQSMLDVYLNMLALDAYLNSRAVLLTSRIASIGNEANRKEVDIGGTTLRRFAHRVVHLQRVRDQVTASLVTGERVTGSVTCRLTESGLE
jgi:DNA repair protein RadA